MGNNLHFRTSDPDLMQETLSPVVGPFLVSPATGSRFHVRVTGVALKKLGLFTVGANSIKVNIQPPLNFFGINVPLGQPFAISETAGCGQFYNDINLVRPDRPMQLETRSDCRVLAVCLYSDPVRDYAAQLNQSDRPLESGMASRLALSGRSGSSLVRSLGRLRTACLATAGETDSELLATEMEDEVITGFVLAAAGGSNDHGRPEKATPLSITKAEEYLCAHLTRPVSRAGLAEISGVSIRTLSRGFMQRHGIGPMHFLKARRLDAAYRCLLGIDPGTTSVTDVALRYGFGHLGKFAIDYRQAFHQSPSHTLNQ